MLVLLIYSREASMTDNIWEEVAYWQQEEEDTALELVINHEMKEADGLQAYRHLARELQSRKDR